MSDSSDEDDQTPVELLEAVQNAELSLLPQKSCTKYIKAFQQFNDWKNKKGAKTFSETVLLAYFIELASSKKPSTLWSIYSMLKSTLKLKKDIHIEKYPKLLAFLKKAATGHKAKKSKIFTAADIEKFLNEAPDSEYLAAKVILIIGISGACRTNELTYLLTKDVEKHSDTLLLFKLPDTKTNIERNFVVRDEYVKIIEKYQKLRPPNTSVDRFFLGYRKGKCINQPIGSNKIGGLPREIASFLGLASPAQYTGHCFRRTSATLLADSGADLTTLKRHGGWKSSTVAEGYLEDSIENKSKICKGIVSGIKLNNSFTDPLNRPSTSRDALLLESWPSDTKEVPVEFADPLNQTSTSRDALLVESWPSDTKEVPVEIAATCISPAHSPTFTLKTTDKENKLPYNNSNTQVTNTSINVPKKNLTINISNCSNINLNFLCYLKKNKNLNFEFETSTLFNFV